MTLEADGDFTFFPKAGTSCTDTQDQFDYTLADNDATDPETDTGTVKIDLANCVWYVDNALGANGAGTSTSPFNTLAVSGGVGLNGAGGAGDSDSAGDFIFLFQGSGNYTGGLPLENTQTLVSQRAGLSVGGSSIFSSTGANATIANAGGNALTLASGNSIQGINLGTTPAGSASLAGSSVGSATMNTTTDGTINNTAGGAVDISTGTVAMAFADLDSSGATGDGIRLDNTAGTFTAGSGSTLTNAGGQDVDISGNNASDSVDFTYDGTIADSTGTVVSIANQSGGTKDFNGAIGTAGSPAGAISLSSNTGATVRFDRSTILSTGAANAFSATGGGTVVVTDPDGPGVGADNTLVTTTGTALNVANTTIGANGLNFKSISASGATNGIVLNTTGSSGGLTVTGNSSGLCGGQVTPNAVGVLATVVAPVPADCTGGTIQNTTGTAVSLTNTDNVSLTRMRIVDSGADSMTINDINGFSLSNSNITDSSGVAQDRGIEMGDFSTGQPVNGAIAITNSTISPTPHDAVAIGISSGTPTFNFTGSQFTNHGNAGINVEYRNATAISSFNISGSNFGGTEAAGSAEGIHMQPAGAGTTGSLDATINNNSFNGNNIAIDVNGDVAADSLYRLTNNTIENTTRRDPAPAAGSNTSSHAINVFEATTSTSSSLMQVRIEGNSIGDTAFPGSGSSIGNGMRINFNGDGQGRVLIDNNTVREAPIGRGIEVIGRNGTGQLDVTVTNNNVNHTDLLFDTTNASNFPLGAIFVNSNCVTICYTVRADARGNVVPTQAGSNPPAASEVTGTYLALVESSGNPNPPGDTSTLELVDVPPASGSCSAQLTSANTGDSGASASCALIPGPINLPAP